DETGAAASGVEVFAAPDLPAPHEWIGLGMKVFTQPPLWAHMATKTGADGSYRLRRVMVGKLMLRAWGATRRTAKTECELVDGKTFVWDGALAPEVNPTWQPFHGVLVDTDGRTLTSSPTPWELRIADPNDARNRKTPFNTIWVNDEGSFRTNRVPPGRYSLFVKPRSPPIGAEVNVGEFDLAACPVRVALPRANVPTSRVRGRIVPPSGVNAKSCFVWIAPHDAPDASDSRRVGCDDQGSFEA